MPKDKKPPGEKKEYKYERVTFMHNGKQYACRGKTLKEAHAKAAKKMLALENGDVGVSGKMTVRRWAEEWLETYKKNAVGEGHYKSYMAYINNIIVPAIGNRKLKDVTDVELQRIVNSRTGNSKSDVTKTRMIIKAIFKRARISRLISYDPAENLTLPAAKEGTHRSITEKERDYILRLARTHHAGLWILTMLYAGLRPGETRALDWRHVDLKKKVINVRLAMKSDTTIISGPKSEAGIRDVPISDELYPHLLAAKGNPFDPVFRHPTSRKRHTKTSMRSLWDNFKRELDISMGAEIINGKIIISAVAPDLVPYCMRHTYCTDLQNAGVPINVAKYLMGHSDISVTANIYTHISEDVLKDAAKKINENAKNSVKTDYVK